MATLQYEIAVSGLDYKILVTSFESAVVSRFTAFILEGKMPITL